MKHSVDKASGNEKKRKHDNQVTSINKRKTHLLGFFLVEQLKKDANNT
jgi:hypothetical protein